MTKDRIFMHMRPPVLLGLAIIVFVVFITAGITAYKWTYQCKAQKVSPDGRFVLEFCPLGYLRLRTSQGKYLNAVRADSFFDAFENLEWKSNSVHFTYNNGDIAIAEWPLITDSSVAPEYKQRDLQYRLTHTYDTSEMEKLIAEGANPNLPDIDGKRKLFEAVIYRNTDMIRFLLEHGADVHTKDETGRTVLHLEASQLEDATLPAIQYLVEHGADVNAVDNDGQTPLHVLNKIEEVKFLVEHGANVNIRDNAGNTPLDSITLWKQALREHLSGDDINWKEYDEPRDQIAAYLRTKGAIVNTTKS